MEKISFALLTSISFAAAHVNALAEKQKRPTFNHLALHVFNLEKSTAFYRDIVGLEVIPEPFKDGKHTWFQIGEHSQLHIIEGAKDVTPRVMTSHLCFSVGSVDDFIANLNNLKIPFTNVRGVAQTVSIRSDGVKQVYFQDPDNYWIEINDDRY